MEGASDLFTFDQETQAGSGQDPGKGGCAVRADCRDPDRVVVAEQSGGGSIERRCVGDEG